MKTQTPSLFALFIGVLMLCVLPVCTTTAPVASSGGGDVAITLSIETPGQALSTYIGGYDTLFVTFSDSVWWSDVTLYKGSAQYTPISSLHDHKVLSVKIPLYWINKPPIFGVDTIKKSPVVTSKYYYDTLYVKHTQGRSASVKVIVENVPPIVDSLVIGTRSYLVRDMYLFSGDFTCLVDTATDSIKMRVTAHDNDGTPTYSWAAAVNDDSLRWDRSGGITSKTACYYVPAKNFKDRVFLRVDDGRGGHPEFTIYLQKTGGVSGAEIDSLIFGDTLFSGKIRHHTMSVYTLDSMIVRSYTHSSGASGVWTCRNGTFTDASSAMPVYKTSKSGAKDTLRLDVTQVIDTLTYTLSTADGDTAVMSVAILKVPVNRRAVIDSLRIGTATTLTTADYDILNGGWLWFVTDTNTTTIALTSYAHDPDGSAKSTMRCTYTKGRSFRGTLSADTGWATVYSVLPDSTYNDTIAIEVVDTLGFSTKKSMVISVLSSGIKSLSRAPLEIPGKPRLYEKQAAGGRHGIILRL